MDRISKARRSANMAAIRSKNTTPELKVRKALFRAGLRYRLHRRDLPGKPDIVLAGRKVAVLVHGCFWHGHARCIDGRRAVLSNTKYWIQKIAGNKKRDRLNKRKLKAAGWHVEEVWECEVANLEKLTGMVERIKHIPAR